MKSLVAAELLKVRTTRAVWVASAVVLAYAVLGPVLVVLAPAGASIPPIEPALLAESLRSPARLAGAAVLLIGLLCTTAEFGHGTVLTTRLAEPRSTRVLAAKLIAMALVAVVLTVAAGGGVDGCDRSPARVQGRRRRAARPRRPAVCRRPPRARRAPRPAGRRRRHPPAQHGGRRRGRPGVGVRRRGRRPGRDPPTRDRRLAAERGRRPGARGAHPAGPARPGRRSRPAPRRTPWPWWRPALAVDRVREL